MSATTSSIDHNRSEIRAAIAGLVLGMAENLAGVGARTVCFGFGAEGDGDTGDDPRRRAPGTVGRGGDARDDMVPDGTFVCHPQNGAVRAFTRDAAMTPKFKELMANIGQEVDYLDQVEFKAFWDADAQHVEDAVRSIGRVDG